MPIVSVVIPFYNHVNWLKEAVESVLNQSYCDYEVLLINDGSCDDISLITPYLNKHNVSYFSQPNRGSSAARNVGIQHSKGKYVAFLDADDLFLSNKLLLQVNILDENPHVVLCHTSYQRINEQGQRLEIVQSGKYSGSVYPDIYDSCPIATPTVMINKKVLEKSNCFIENIHIGEDVLLWAELAHMGLVYGIDKPLTLVRMHGQNAFNTPKDQIVGDNNILKYGILKAQDISWKQKRRFLSNKYHNIAYNYYRVNEKWKAVRNSAYAFWYDPFRSSSLFFSDLLRLGIRFRRLFK